MGNGKAPNVSITSIALAISIIFYTYVIGAYLKIQIFPFQGRINYFKQFDFVIISPYFDIIIIISAILTWVFFSIKNKRFRIFLSGAIVTIGISSSSNIQIADLFVLVSVPSIIFVIILDKICEKKILRNHSDLTLNYLFITGSTVGIISIVINAVSIFNPQIVPSRDPVYEVYLLLSSFSPVYILLMLSCVPLKITTEFLVKRIKLSDEVSATILKPSIRAAALLLCILLVITITLIPHMPTLNKENKKIGVDTQFYVTWLNSLKQSKDGQEYLHKAFLIPNGGDRPISLILFDFLSKFNGENVSKNIEYLPVLLGPLLVLSVYCFARQIMQEVPAIISAFFTAVSFQTLGGIYAGYYANWLALVIGYLAVAIMLKFLQNQQKKWLICYMVSLVVLLFSHDYTWTIFVTVMAVFTAIMFKFKNYEKKALILVLVMIGLSITIDLGRMTILESSGGIEKDIQMGITEGQVSPSTFSSRWSNLLSNSALVLGGQIGNFLLLFLGIYWVFSSNFRKPGTILLMVFFSIGLVPVIFGDWVIQNRLLYDLPFQIPAALALSQFRIKMKNQLPILFFIAWMISIAIRYASNLSFTPSSVS